MELTSAIYALIIFTALTAALALALVFYRSSLIMTGKTSADSWTRGAEKWQDSSIMQRVQHAHLNCLENLPIFAIIVLVAAFIGKLTIIDDLACIFIGLRLAQTVTHIVMVNHWAVMLRATFYIGQMALIAYWLLKLVSYI